MGTVSLLLGIRDTVKTERHFFIREMIGGFNDTFLYYNLFFVSKARLSNFVNFEKM